MSLSKRQLEKLRTILRQAYREKEDVGSDEFSPADVMDRIRKVRCEPMVLRISCMFARTLWRLAPVVCLLILLMAVMIRIFPPFDFSSDNETFQSLADEREELTLPELFGA